MGRKPARDSGARVLHLLRQEGVWTSNPKAKLAVSVRDAALVSKYAFGTRTATFHICSRCRAVPLVTSEIAKRFYAVVNVNVFENVDPSRLRRASADFEGEDVESRLTRRARNWIADVRFADRQNLTTPALRATPP